MDILYAYYQMIYLMEAKELLFHIVCIAAAIYGLIISEISVNHHQWIYQFHIVWVASHQKRKTHRLFHTAWITGI